MTSGVLIPTAAEELAAVGPCEACAKPRSTGGGPPTVLLVPVAGSAS